MSASVSSQGFAVVRGRRHGYPPEQVDRVVAMLEASRDEAWERVARLTVLVKELEERKGLLRNQVTVVPPQTFRVLGAPAQELLATVETEAADLLDAAEAAAHEVREEGEKAARSVGDAARVYAAEVRADAARWAERCRVAAQRAADHVRGEALREAEELRAQAAAVLEDTRRQAAILLVEQGKKQAARSRAAELEIAEAEAQTRAWIEELGARGEAALAEAQRAYAETQEAAWRVLVGAEERCEELLARARAWEERVVWETEWLLEEHRARREELRSALAHVCDHLSALTVGVDSGAVRGRAHGGNG
jgi:cell division septum initiation protein DivIVA